MVLGLNSRPFVDKTENLVAWCMHADLYICIQAESSVPCRAEVKFCINQWQEIREKSALLTKIRKGVLGRQHRKNLSPGEGKTCRAYVGRKAPPYEAELVD